MELLFYLYLYFKTIETTFTPNLPVAILKSFKECLWQSSFVFNLLEKVEKDGYKLFVCLVEFAWETIWSWTFVCRECFFITYSISFLWLVCSVDLFLLDSVLTGHNSLESCLILLGCQIYWHIIIHSILLWVFFIYFCGIHWDFSFFISYFVR